MKAFLVKKLCDGKKSFGKKSFGKKSFGKKSFGKKSFGKKAFSKKNFGKKLSANFEKLFLLFFFQNLKKVFAK
jgi:hypothetical protein